MDAHYDRVYQSNMILCASFFNLIGDKHFLPLLDSLHTSFGGWFQGSSQKLSFLLQTPSFRPAALGHPTVVAFFLWIDWLMFWCLLFGSQSLINAVVSDIPWHSFTFPPKLVAQHVRCHLVCMSASPPPQRQFRWSTGVGSPILCPQQAIIKHTRNSAGPSWGVLFWSHDWCEIGLFVSQCCNPFCWSSAGRGRCVEMRQAAEKWWFFLQLSAMLSSIDYWPVAIVCRDVWYKVWTSRGQTSVLKTCVYFPKNALSL